ncbi:hypothetical protein ACLD02_19325 [Alloalcanivorax sp. C16-2]|uniref:hypothetical protein n=1 Tax=Alloalcanivorax sp. C16-2 TaxID=3390052 RepID=UPI003970C492
MRIKALFTTLLVATALAGPPARAVDDEIPPDNRPPRLETNRDATETLRQRGRDQAGEHRRIMRERMDRLDSDARDRNDRVRERSQRAFDGFGAGADR